MSDRPAIYAHRGGAGLRPENTMGAFRNAVDLGVDGLELDVHLSKDGAIVVSHDPTVDRTTNGTGKIRNLTRQELSALDAGHSWTHDGKVFPFRGRGYTIPTLPAVLEAFPDVTVSIDIKEHSRRAVDAVVAALRKFDRVEQAVVGSFSAAVVRRYRKLVPEGATAFSQRETLRLVLASRAFGAGRRRPPGAVRAATHLMVPPVYKGLPVITRESVERAQRAGAVVGAWTINAAPQMREMIDLGVDIIITDRPDVARELAQEL
ncbi:MAG: glycerophosphodiester phosphodiesterase [Spirochaetes bacterium]|jgi:glycerophosphoryl diester phosphodiesterase|nr:glycerophosphodiester phosphodiesterase [Spirochaetota bacterium]